MKSLYFAKQVCFIISFLNFFYATGQTSLNNGLTACYLLDGNAAEPINSLTGTLNAVTPTADRFNTPGSACLFNGNGYIELPNDALLKSGMVSFSGWVKFNSVANSQFIAFVENGCSSNQEGYQLAITANINPPKFQIAKALSNCSSQKLLNSQLTPAIDTWYHVGFYAGPDSLKLYVNGALEGAVSHTYPLAYDQQAHVYLGGSINATINLPLSGALDNARFYNRKLTDSEMNQLYLLNTSCLITTDLGDLSNTSSFIISPNPTSGRLSIESSGAKTYFISICDALGRIVSEKHLEGNERWNLDISGLPSGIYLVKLTDETGNTQTKKLIKGEG